MNNLTQRILTAGVLIPAVLLLVFNAPIVVFWAFLLVIILISFYEFFKLVKFNYRWQLLTIFGAIVFVYLFLFATLLSPLVLIITVILLGFWIKNIELVLRYPNITHKDNKIFKVINAILLITPLFLLHFLKIEGSQYLLLLLLIVWGADSFAYFAGKKFGKTKLAPKVSGGKTIEGLIGGIAGSVVLTMLWMHFNEISNYWFILLAIITAIFSVIGDLYESIYKREAGVKDSGNILPGHGGILDRIDGLLGAIPIFTIGLFLII